MDLSKNDLRLILKQQAMVGKSAFGDFWIPSFAMSVMVSVGVTLLILTLWWCMGNTMDMQCTKARRKIRKSATKMFGNEDGADGNVKTAIVTNGGGSVSVEGSHFHVGGGAAFHMGDDSDSEDEEEGVANNEQKEENYPDRFIPNTPPGRHVKEVKIMPSN